VLQIYEMELERIKYLLRSYLKLRIKKVAQQRRRVWSNSRAQIEKFFMYISKSTHLLRRLSLNEQTYLKSYVTEKMIVACLSAR
jgi:hypothetical protein